MKKEISYGIVPLRIYRTVWQVLIIQHHAGHWAFPKGHANLGEMPQQTAERELHEETGLTIQRYLSPQPIIESYIFSFQGELISKSVHYFLAVVKGKVIIQESEIKASQWVSLSEAMKIVTFKESKRICLQTSEFLKLIKVF